jgi:hypothetical protein
MIEKAKIYQPVKTAMQSGKARTKFWILEFNKNNFNNEQVKLKFETKDQAIAYAKENKIQFDLITPKKNKLIIKSYADNFLNNV